MKEPLFQTAMFPTALSSKKPEPGPPHYTKSSSIRTKRRRGNWMESEKKQTNNKNSQYFRWWGLIHTYIYKGKEETKKKKGNCWRDFTLFYLHAHVHTLELLGERGRTRGPWSICVHCDTLQKVQTRCSVLLLLAKTCRDSHVFFGGKQHLQYLTTW